MYTLGMMAVADLQLNTVEVRRRREKLGLTLDAAAKAAGLRSRQGWYNIESNPKGNDVTISTLGRIAKALNCAPEDLLK